MHVREIQRETDVRNREILPYTEAPRYTPWMRGKIHSESNL